MVIWTGVLYGAVEALTGQGVEPLLSGHSTGLSPFAVVVAATFWTWLWGPIGLLLSTPLTVCLVVLGRHVEALSFLHIALGDQSPLEPAETFYQRALEGNQEALLRQARSEAARSGPTEYFDRVAMAGLALAQADLSRDALGFDRLDAIHGQIERLLLRLGEAFAPAQDAARTAPAGYAAPGTVLCIPGRGQLDDLAATMATQALRARGLGATALPNAALDGAVPGAAEVRLCFISAIEEGSSAASIRFFVRRIQRRMPGAAVVIGLWQATSDSTTLAALRAEGGDEFIVLSVGELLALALALAARSGAGEAESQRSGQTSPINGTPHSTTTSDNGAPSRQ